MPLNEKKIYTVGLANITKDEPTQPISTNCLTRWADDHLP